MKILDHQTLSLLSSQIVNSILGTNLSSGGQCFGISSLAVLAMDAGPDARRNFINYLRLLNALYYLRLKATHNKVNFIELIHQICNGEIPQSNEWMQRIRLIDPQLTLLKTIPIFCIYNFIYQSPELIEGLFELVGEKKPLDQDFMKTHSVLKHIGLNNALIIRLNSFFLHYDLLTKRSFVDDFTLLQKELLQIDRHSKDSSSASLFSMGMYLKSELELYFDCIQAAVDGFGDKISQSVQFVTYSPTHAISISYNAHEQKWYIIDSLNLTEENIVDGISASQAAARLCNYFSNELSAGFTSLIYCNPKLQAHLKSALSICFVWKNIHDLNRKELIESMQHEYGKRTIIDIVLTSDDLTFVTQVIESKYFVAFSDHNYAGTVQLLMYLINKNNPELVNLIISKIKDSKEFRHIISEIIKNTESAEFFVLHNTALISSLILPQTIHELKCLLLAGAKIDTSDIPKIRALFADDMCVLNIINSNNLFRELIIYKKSLESSAIASRIRFIGNTTASEFSTLKIIASLDELIDATRKNEPFSKECLKSLPDSFLSKLPIEIFKLLEPEGKLNLEFIS